MENISIIKNNGFGQVMCETDHWRTSKETAATQEFINVKAHRDERLKSTSPGFLLVSVS